MTRRRWSLLAAILVGVAVIAVAAATIWQLNADPPSTSASADPPPATPSASAALDPCPTDFGPRPGSVSADEGLPDLTLPCLSGDGELALDTAPGVPLVLNVWASWCGPCEAELPHLQELYIKADGAVEVLGVDILDGRPQALQFAGDAGMTFPSLFDADGELQQWSGIPGPPFTLLIDADGAVVHRKIGQVTSYAELRDLVETHLGVELP